MKALVLALAAAAIVSTQTGGGATGFTAHEIGTGLRGGYQVVVADLNKDGKPDIIALASGLPELLWYENPGWQKHVLASGVSQLINAAAYDIDGDGIPEIAVAQGFTMSPKTSKGQIGLLTHGADVTAPWTYKEIDAVPTAHRIRWIDADGSGKKMLAMAPLIGHGLDAARLQGADVDSVLPRAGLEARGRHRRAHRSRSRHRDRYRGTA